MSSLISKLHEALMDFVSDIEQIIDENRQMSYEEIMRLRSHIIARLDKKEEVEDNKRLISLLDLFSTNKAIMELIKEDSEEWVELIEAISRRASSASTERGQEDQEQEEIKRIQVLTQKIKGLIRTEAHR